MKPESVAIVLGTRNRFELLKRSIESIRRSVYEHSYQIIVIDGYSTDGSSRWLRAQDDVIHVLQKGPLTGAVKAFNLGFGLATVAEFDYVAHLNDDAELLGTGAIDQAIDLLKENPRVGEIAFSFDLWGDWHHDTINSVPYGNYGVIRREAGMAVARAQGDDTGQNWWDPGYFTYGADTQFGVWLWKLGWKVLAVDHLQVHDHRADDLLRANNSGLNREKDSELFWSRWRDENLAQYLEKP